MHDAVSLPESPGSPIPRTLRRSSLHHDEETLRRLHALAAEVDLPVAEIERRLLRYSMQILDRGTDPRAVLFPPKGQGR